MMELRIPEVLQVTLPPHMAHFPYAGVEYWHAKAEERRLEHIGGRLVIKSRKMKYGAGQYKYAYIVSGYVRKREPDARDSS